MKFTVTMKYPDSLYDAIQDAVESELKESSGIMGEEEVEAILEIRKKNIQELCREWFQYGEYLTVEIDTEAKTATVCKAKD